MSRAALKNESSFVQQQQQKKTFIAIRSLTLGTFRTRCMCFQREEWWEKGVCLEWWYSVLIPLPGALLKVATACESSSLYLEKIDIFGEGHDREAGWHIISNDLFFGLLFSFR